MGSARRACRLLSPLRATLLLVVLGGLAGCRPGTALHRRYNNFRAYYNTYYNAEQKLEEGERGLVNASVAVDRTRLIELFPSTSPTAGRTPVFDAAIDKSAELLRRRPDSRWADDALLVIGKAYFYERNFVGAEQKFRETIAAATLLNDRELADEARFWLGRTMAGAERYDEGVLVLREALEQRDGDRYWQGRMHLALGELYARAGRWDAATVDLRDGLAVVRDADIGARGALLLGQVEEAAGRYDAAAEAYAEAVRRQPSYEIAFAAELNRNLVLGLDAGQAAQSLAALRAMSRDDKNYARRAEVALAQARVLAEAGEAEQARERFRAVLYDPAMAGSSVRGEAHYRFAEFYRDALGDYVTAAAHFDTAATAIQLPAPSVRSSRAALLGVRDLATTYGTVARTSARIAAVDSLLELGTLSDEAFRERIAAIESVRRDEWVRQRREEDAIRAQQDFSGTALAGTTGASAFEEGASRGTGTPTTGSDGAAAASTAETGFLGFRDPRTIQTGLISFQRIYGDRPLVPNWRRRQAVQGGALSGGVGLGFDSDNLVPGAATLGGPPPLDLSGIPRTPEAQETLIVERASLRYELANTFFLALGRSDRAGVLYQQILTETPEAPVASRARYALAELETAAGRTEAAMPLYRDVADSDSLGTLGLAALARLEGREPVAEAPVVSTEDDDAYRAARAVWDNGDPLGATAQLLTLGEASPTSEGAPRAYLAAALAYADWAQADSVALAAVLPTDLFTDSLMTSCPVPAEADAPVEAEEDDVIQDLSAAPEEEADAPITFSDGAAPTRGSRRDRQPRIPQPAGVPAPVGVAPVGVPEPAGVPEPVGVSQPLGAPPSAVAVDSVGTPALETPDETGTPEGIPESAPAAIRPDTLAATPDSLFVTGWTMREYLEQVAACYPETPFAVRAQALAATLPSPETATDSTLVVAVDSLAAPPVPEATLSTPAEPTVDEVTWRVGPFATRAEAEARLALVPADRVLASVATDGTSFYVLIGQFASATEAVRAGKVALARLVDDATVEPVTGLTLLTPAGDPADSSLPVQPGTADDS